MMGFCPAFLDDSASRKAGQRISTNKFCYRAVGPRLVGKKFCLENVKNQESGGEAAETEVNVDYAQLRFSGDSTHQEQHQQGPRFKREKTRLYWNPKYQNHRTIKIKKEMCPSRLVLSCHRNEVMVLWKRCHEDYLKLIGFLKWCSALSVFVCGGGVSERLSV